MIVNLTHTPKRGCESTCYPNSFFDFVDEGAVTSAEVIVPLVLRLIQPASVIDVGCARGAWLKVFKERGVSRVMGLDGKYVNAEQRWISPGEFSEVDLSRPFTITERYDLAVCLEVAEHLPVSSGCNLVRQLTAAAPFVLFSAAIPGQGGTNHVNEQWPPYWQALFRQQGYLLCDAIRRDIWHDRRVEWWYRQNIALYAAEDVLGRSQPRMHEIECESMPEWIHISVLRSREAAVSRGSLRSVCRQLPRLVVAAIHRRWQRLSGTSS